MLRFGFSNSLSFPGLFPGLALTGPSIAVRQKGCVTRARDYMTNLAETHRSAHGRARNSRDRKAPEESATSGSGPSLRHRGHYRGSFQTGSNVTRAARLADAKAHVLPPFAFFTGNTGNTGNNPFETRMDAHFPHSRYSPGTARSHREHREQDWQKQEKGIQKSNSWALHRKTKIPTRASRWQQRTAENRSYL